MTETRTEAAAAAPIAVAPMPEHRGVLGWLMTGDHKRVGRLYLVSALLMGLGALGIGAALGFDKIDVNRSAIQSDAVGQLFSMYQWVLAVGVVVPLLLGIAIAVVPLQVGARSVAFPRAAALSFWGWLAGMGALIGAYIDNGGPGGGNSEAVDLWILSLIVVTLALLVGLVCVLTTILTLRAPGMRLDEIPVFSWSVLVAGSVLLLALPVLVAVSIFLFVDNHNGRLVFGGNLKLGEYVQWAIRQPMVGLYALPALGILADVTSTHGHKRIPSRDALLLLLGLGAVVGFGAYAQQAFYPEVTSKFVYVAANILAVLPPLAVIVLAGFAMGKGTKIGGPVVLAMSAGLLLLGGAALGALIPISGLDLQGTVAELAQLNLTLWGGVLGGLAAIAHWGPKLWGRKLSTGASAGLGLLVLLGVALMALPDVVSGFNDQPNNAVTFDVSGPHQLLNALSFAGYLVVLVALLAFLVLMFQGFRRGEAAGDDPWDGQTLEWATSSPPPAGNFAELPFVTSPEPLLDRKEA